MNLSHNEDEKNILKLADSYFQKGLWDKAIEECLKLLKSNPDHTEIYNFLGDVYAKKADHSQAFKAYNKVLTDLINHGQNYKTAELFKKIASLDREQLGEEGKNKQTIIQLQLDADEALSVNKSDEAIQYLNKVLKLDPFDFTVVLKLAQLFEILGRNSDAVQQYTRFGEAFLKNKSHKKAMEIFKKIVSLEPESMEAHRHLAEIHLKLDSEFDAKNEYCHLAEIALGRNDLDSAFEYALKAIDLKSLDAYYVLGIVLFERKKWLDSKIKFDDFLRFRPGHVGAQVYLGKIFDALDQPAKAVQAFQKALKMDKENMMALEVWAEYCVKTKNNDEAIKTYNLLIEKSLSEDQDMRTLEWARLLVAVDENSAPSQLKLAQILEKNGDLDAAGETYFNLVSIYSKEKNSEEAEKYRRKTLELKPLHAKALALDPGKMRLSEETSAAVQTQSSPVRFQVEKPVSETMDSEPLIAKLPEVNPREIRLAQISLADQYIFEGQLNEAIDILQKLAEGNPHDLIVKEKLNRVYVAYSKADTNLTDDSELSPQPQIVITHFMNQEKPHSIHDESFSETKSSSKEGVPGFKLEAAKKARLEAEKKNPKRSKRKFV
jgi:tetratricopeptide (TPR) repeat protein